MVVVEVEAPGVVLGVEALVCEAGTHFETGLVGNGVGRLAIGELVAVHEAHANKGTGGETLAKNVGIGELGAEVEMIEVEVTT